MQNYLVIGLQIISLILLAFSLVFTLGIIWRVEMKLDSAYKVFFVALVFIFLATVLDVFIKNEFFIIVDKVLNLLFAIFLLVGIWMMRDLMRNIDGEKR
ncbi:MAG: hypothetical protein WAV16_02675 [Candidatus Moraniibacteriota bacterium]